jgi:hypothetical protein
VRRVLPLIAALALGLLGPCACAPAVVPAPETPAAAPSPPAATVAPTPTPAPQPTKPDAAWTEVRTEELVLRMPASWQVDQAGDAAAALPAFAEGNPELAGFLGGARLEGVFSARDRASSTRGIADNLNIRRTATDGGGGERLAEIAAGVAAQYKKLGLNVQETATGIEIGGLPAARIVTAFAAAGRGGANQDLIGWQLLVAAPDALWILTYTTTAERSAGLREVFEESAESFRVR